MHGIPSVEIGFDIFFFSAYEGRVEKTPERTLFILVSLRSCLT